MTLRIKTERNGNFLLGFSPWILAIACTLLLLLLTLFTVSNYRREKELIGEALVQKGLTLMRFINSSTREAIRENIRSSRPWVRWEEQIQTVMEQAVEQPGVEYVLLIDSTGAILSGAGKNLPEKKIDGDTLAFVRGLQPEGQMPFVSRFNNVVQDDENKKKFQIASWSLPPMMPQRMPEMLGRGPGRGGQMMGRFAHHPEYAKIQEEMEKLFDKHPLYLVQLDFEQFNSPLRRQLLQIIILSAVILLVGIGGALSFMTLRGLKGYLTEVKLLEKELQRSERLAALGKMAAGVAHELRNPLSSIKGLAVLLKSHFTEPGREAETADVLVKEVERLNRSIGELLDYAKPGQLNKESASIAGILKKTVSLIRIDAEAYGIAIDLHLGGDLPEIKVDQDKLNQVFLNLLLNAIQAMPNGGRLGVHVERDDRNIIVRIRDTGVGILPENLQRVFDPYYTTKGDGTGLGLAMSAKIVEEHGGQIKIFSTPQEYTEVRVILPI
ncbi:MAG: Sensor protein [uncultured bacterium]|nr:MAG: Sensor protein [uncultured bacterium]